MWKKIYLDAALFNHVVKNVFVSDVSQIGLEHSL